METNKNYPPQLNSKLCEGGDPIYSFTTLFPLSRTVPVQIMCP